MYIDFDRFDKLVEETGKTKSHLCRSIGKTRYYLRDAKKMNVNVPEDVVETLAFELNTTVDYLTGKSDIKEKSPAEAGDLDAESNALVDKLDYDQLVELIFKATKRAEELKKAQQKLGE